MLSLSVAENNTLDLSQQTSNKSQVFGNKRTISSRKDVLHLPKRCRDVLLISPFSLSVSNTHTHPHTHPQSQHDLSFSSLTQSPAVVCFPGMDLGLQVICVEVSYICSCFSVCVSICGMCMYACVCVMACVFTSLCMPACTHVCMTVIAIFQTKTTSNVVVQTGKSLITSLDQ